MLDKSLPHFGCLLSQSAVADIRTLLAYPSAQIKTGSSHSLKLNIVHVLEQKIALAAYYAEVAFNNFQHIN